MKRREALKTISIISAAAVFFPSCTGSDSSVLPLKNLTVSASQQDMLAGICEAVIPKTQNFSGAKDINAHLFLLTMMDDCEAPGEQKKFLAGMKEFEKAFEKKYGSSFSKATPSGKLAWLKAVQQKENTSGDMELFYNKCKQYTIQAFTTSKEYMTKVLDYKMVPGSNYKGCVPVKKQA